MGEIPVQENTTATTVSDIIDISINSVSVQVVDKMAVAYLPFLGIPGIHLIFKFILNKIAGEIFTQLNRVGINLVIDLQTDSEVSAYSNAEEKLHNASLSGDPIAIKAASDEFDRTIGSLIKWDGIVK